MQKMKFSVIVPVYNRGNMIASVIDSVVSQSYSAWELILVDDGSTDSTAEICKRYADQDERVLYYYKDNGGVSSARNYGIREAKGEFIVFLDSDNSLMADMLEKLNRALSGEENVDFVVYGFNTSASSEWIPTEREDELLITRQAVREKYLPTHFNIYAQDTHFLKNYVWNKAYRTSFLKENGILFDESRRTLEDGIFVINCLDKANKILVLLEAIYNAYCSQKVDHLSSKLFVDQVLQYINDERDYKNRFGMEMDFSTDHYIASNFNVINSMFERMVQTFGNDAKPVIDRAIRVDIVKYWAERCKPEHETGKRLKKLIMDGNSAKVYDLYHPSLFQRAARKALRSIRHKI